VPHALRRLAALAATVLVVAGLAAGPAAADPRAPAVAARNAVLIDGSTGAVLWQRNEHVPVLIASTTKILTALVAEQTFPPAEVFTVPRAAEQVDGTRFGYKTGMRVRRHELLATLLLVSANDAAETLAAAYPAGGRAGFLRAMQATAESLGCTDSTWRSPSGLEAPGHRVSAADLAIVGRQLLAEPELARLVASRTARYRWPDGHVQVLTNHNHFVADGHDPGAIGVKTGYTVAARHTTVAAERRAGRTLVAVVLGDPSLPREEADVRSMFQYGFATRAPPGAELLGAAGAGLGRSEARSAVAPGLPGKGGQAPLAPAAARRGLAAVLHADVLAAPMVIGTAGGAVLLALGVLTVMLLRPRRAGAARPPAAGRAGPASRPGDRTP
jgi:D-alanyl-D-alanine carboxypeptidase (penicillin-binding protein 5/6)